MKNTYQLSNIHCTNCGLEIEYKVSKLDGVINASFNVIFMNLHVEFDENVITDEEIEKCIHRAYKGVKIVKKNNKDFLDTYEEESIFMKIMKRRKELKNKGE